MCAKVARYFKNKADVRRHLQEQHSGIQFQCGLCGYYFHRRSIGHACNAREEDFEYADPTTGEYGEPAKFKLRSFIRKEQDKHWKYMESDADLPESPFPEVRSVVFRVDPPIQPRERKRPKTPESLGSPESISLEEPPTKKQQLDELMRDLECTPSSSSSVESPVDINVREREMNENDKAEKTYDKETTKEPVKINESNENIVKNIIKSKEEMQKKLNKARSDTDKDKRVVKESDKKNTGKERVEKVNENNKKKESMKETVEKGNENNKKKELMKEKVEKVNENNKKKESMKETVEKGDEKNKKKESVKKTVEKGNENDKTKESMKGKDKDGSQKKCDKKKTSELEKESDKSKVNKQNEVVKAKTNVVKETENYKKTDENKMVQNQNETEQSSYMETINAVATITDDTVQGACEKAAGVVSELVVDLVEQLVIHETVEDIVDGEMESAVTEIASNDVSAQMDSDPVEVEHNEKGSENHSKQNKKRNEMLTYLKSSQENRITLNIGGTKFETSESTLKQDPDSLFALLFDEGVPDRNNYFIDRDPAHFRIILNYLRWGCSLPTEAVLPVEPRYLLEIREECEFYNLNGLKKILNRRLRRLAGLE